MGRGRFTYPVYRQPSQVTFGTGSVRTLADPTVLKTATLFVSANPTVQGILHAAFEKQGVAWDAVQMLEKPGGEPTSETVARGAEWLSNRQCSTLIAVGGGSVLDWARLSLAAARGWLDLSTGALREGGLINGRPEIVLVPTTCGTGAEAAAVAVYSAGSRKLAVVSQAFIADRVVLDAQFLEGLEATARASFLSDALSHAVEGYVSILPNPLAKEAAVSALRLILQHHAAPAGHCRDERLMEAAYLGGIAASNCSVGIVHAFAHTMSAYGVPHGVANALGLAAGIRINASTTEMGNFLRHAGFNSVETLIAGITPVVAAASATSAANGAWAALADAAERDRIIAAMMGDVCLRTNPRRLERGDLATFLGDIERSAEIA